MKRQLPFLLIPLCGSLFAQEHIEPLRSHPPGASEHPILLAQSGGQNRPGVPPGPANPLPPPIQPAAGAHGGRGPGVPPPQAPGQPGVGASGNRLPAAVQRGGAGAAVVAPFDRPQKRTLVVGSSKLNDTAREQIREDMQIMSRLLDKVVDEALEGARERRMGIVVTTIPGARGENLYFEDYGPVFILNVPIPLSGTRQKDGTDSGEENSEWEQAKRELYQPRPGFEPLKYDAQKVEALKKELLGALKNAANIRELKPDQHITLIVTGSPGSPAMFNRMVVHKRDGEAPREEKQVMERRPSAPQETTLTIRVKKSDVDAFAKGKMTVDEFSRKALISTN